MRVEFKATLLVSSIFWINMASDREKVPKGKMYRGTTCCKATVLKIRNYPNINFLWIRALINNKGNMTEFIENTK